ncbi:hypothetical protein WJX79_004769 [Trebouxia sp. C0005]
MASSSESKGLIVLATDNSQSALNVVDFALKHFSTGYHLHVVHVQTVHKNLMNHADEDYKEAGVTQADITNKAPQATTQEVEKQSFLVDTILPKFDTLASQGTAVKATVVYVPENTAHAIGKALCKFAKQHNAAQLVMERTSKNFLSEFFLGSVASYCASHSPVPLVILKS